MNTVTELYPADGAGKLERKTKTWTILTAAAAVLLFVVCVLLCVLTNTANAAAMELRVCLISLLGGWAVIFCHVHFIRGSKRELAHFNNLKDEPREAVSGEVTLDPARVSISRSITVQTLLIRDGERTHRVHINAKKTGLLPALPARLTVYTAHGYAVAWEVQDAVR
ncbi:MAG: hypothetical protein J5865_08805 [Lachnospiraceae bacterium]|nr:hypothetical protein [Lachnospiraceae bacterium]